MAGEDEAAARCPRRCPMASTGQEAAGLRIGVNVQPRAMQADMAALRLALAARGGMKRAQLRDVKILED